MTEKADEATSVEFFRSVLEAVKEDPDSPVHGTSKFFVSCFSADEDNLNQWRLYGGKNPYGIGFYARDLNRERNSQLYRVIYDREKQQTFVREVVDATLRFYQDGLVGERLEEPTKWAELFLPLGMSGSTNSRCS